MRMSTYGAIAAVAILAGTTAANAGVTLYTDEMAFMAAQASGPGMVMVEDFDDTSLIPGLTYMSDAGFIDGGLFNDRVVDGAAMTMFKKWSMTSFGGTWDLTPDGFGQGLKISIMLDDGTNVDIGSLNAYTGFFGFTSMDSFKKVTIMAFDPMSGAAETYSLDNVKLAMVPEPGSWAMLIAGFGLVGAVARRRRSHAVAA